MHARDAAGRQVSLLNDDSSSLTERAAPPPSHPQRPLPFVSQPYPASSRSNSASSSLPNTPELLRSDSYDSQMSNDPLSPLTPSVDYAFPRQAHYPIPHHEYMVDGPLAKRPAYAASHRSASFDDDCNSTTASATSPMPERPTKRYPCRYRDSHGCEKTFTTSGHASRHSKIHTAEKAVQCTYTGCQKKFTRADNMKQHLETHYKDKSRSSSGHRTQKAAIAEARRHSASGRSLSAGRSLSGRDATSTSAWEPAPTEQYALPTPPLPSPTGTCGAWDMRGLNLPLPNRPVASRVPSGLDALAMAIACQEGA